MKTKIWVTVIFLGILFLMFWALRVIVSEPRELAQLAPVSDEEWLTLATTDTVMQTGSLQYKLRCYKCHGPTGEGTFKGPNLTDDIWVYGDSYSAIYNVLYYGAGTMKNYGKKMSKEDLKAITVYVKQLSK